MNIHKILLKIAYWLIAISIVIMLGLTFFSRQLVKKQSRKAVTVKEAFDTETKIRFSDMSISIDDTITKKDTEKFGDPTNKEEENNAVQDK